MFKLNTTEYTKQLSKQYNRKFKQIKDEEFSNPINSDKHMIITRKQTARETVKYCHKVGRRLVNIDSNELQTVIELRNIQREISLNDPDLTVEDYNTFWQNVKLGPSGQYVFANTDKSLPLSLNNKNVKNKVHPLGNNCVHYIKDINEFNRASCTDKVKKYGICQSEVNRNDILVLESHLATYEEEIKELNATRLLLQQQIDQLEEDHVSDNKPIIANIFSKFQGKLINSIATFTENSLNSRGLNVLINANKALLTRLRTLSIKPDEKGCNLFLDDFEFPVRGSIFVNMITGDNTIIPTTFTTNSSFPHLA